MNRRDVLLYLSGGIIGFTLARCTDNEPADEPVEEPTRFFSTLTGERVYPIGVSSVGMKP